MKLFTFFTTRGWCQNALARDAAGEPCPPSSPDARAWNLISAMLLILNRQEIDRACRQLEAKMPVTDYPVIAWNDRPGRTRAQVVALLKKLDI